MEQHTLNTRAAVAQVSSIHWFVVAGCEQSPGGLVCLSGILLIWLILRVIDGNGRDRRDL